MPLATTAPKKGQGDEGPTALFSVAARKNLRQTLAVEGASAAPANLLRVAAELASGHPNAPSQVKNVGGNFVNMSELSLEELGGKLMGSGVGKPNPSMTDVCRFVQNGGLRGKVQVGLN